MQILLQFNSEQNREIWSTSVEVIAGQIWSGTFDTPCRIRRWSQLLYCLDLT